jgi:hypothetical protein
MTSDALSGGFTQEDSYEIAEMLSRTSNIITTR